MKRFIYRIQIILWKYSKVQLNMQIDIVYRPKIIDNIDRLIEYMAIDRKVNRRYMHKKLHINDKSIGIRQKEIKNISLQKVIGYSRQRYIYMYIYIRRQIDQKV